MKQFRLTLLVLLASSPLVVFGAETQGSFVPLTSLPGIEDFAGQSSLPNLLNAIYRISIGAAAVIAVLQIMRAGVLYMGGDSVTEKREAKNLLGMSIGGLLLVLSPVIVFSIINPSILSLNIGLDRIQLNSAGSGGSQNPPNSGQPSSGSNQNGQPAAGSCLSYSSKAATPRPLGDTTGQVCSTLGAGWEKASSACCILADEKNYVCCGKKTTSP